MGGVWAGVIGPRSVTPVLRGWLFVSRVRNWLDLWWLRVPEPRALSILWGLAYSISFLLGCAALVAPPSSSFGLVDSFVFNFIAVVHIVGAPIAMVAGARDYWALERIGLYMQASGLAAYMVTVVVLQFSGTGNRWMQLCLFGLALCCLAARYLLIRIYTRKPRTMVI